MSDASTTPPQSNPAAASEAAADEAKPLPLGVFGERLKAAGIAVEACPNDATGKETVRIPAESLLAAAHVLRHELQFDLLVSVAAVDWKTHRESVTHVYSTHTHQYLTIKTVADAEDKLPSLVPVWPAANWHEREAFDLMGIHYQGHPDLRRILMPVDWVGYPLRKDYVENDPRLVWNRR